MFDYMCYSGAELRRAVARAITAERQACARDICPRCAADQEVRFEKSEDTFIHRYPIKGNTGFAFCDAALIWRRARLSE